MTRVQIAGTWVDWPDPIYGVVTGQSGLRVYIGHTDPVSDLPVFVDYGEHQVNEGEAHGWEYYTETPATRNFALIVPVYAIPIRAPHFMMHMQSYGGAGMLSVWEGATYTGGTPATNIYNRNRNSAIIPGMTIVDGVTSSNGTRLPYTAIAGAGEKTSETTRANDKVILKSNTIYVIRYEEITATTRLAIHFEWTEDLGV